MSENRNGTNSPPFGRRHQPSSPRSIMGRAWYAEKWNSWKNSTVSPAEISALSMFPTLWPHSNVGPYCSSGPSV